MSKNCDGKTTSGDNFLEGTVVIGGDLIVEDTLTTNQLIATTEHVTNLDATNAVINTATINNSSTTNATITTSNTTTANITTANVVTETVNTVNASVVNATSANLNNANISHGNASLTNLTATNVTINNSSIIFDSLSFYYISGSFQPILTYLLPDGTAGGNVVDFTSVAGSSSTVNYENGYFERMGSQVTVHFSVSYNAINSGYAATGYGFPAIRNLPYTFSALGGILDYQEVETLGTCSWPNGFAGSVPALYVPTYPYPYEGKLYEANYVIPLDFWVYIGAPVALYKGPHTCDGTTIPLYGQATYYDAVVGVPPYSEIVAIPALLTNFNMLATATYVVSFEGRFTYNT
jgi:hypothetical protein